MRQGYLKKAKYNIHTNKSTIITKKSNFRLLPYPFIEMKYSLMRDQTRKPLQGCGQKLL